MLSTSLQLLSINALNVAISFPALAHRTPYGAGTRATTAVPSYVPYTKRVKSGDHATGEVTANPVCDSNVCRNAPSDTRQNLIVPRCCHNPLLSTNGR